MKYSKHHLLIASLLSTMLVLPHVHAQSRKKTTTRSTVTKKKTVGEMLAMAEDSSRGGRVQMSKTDTALPSSNLGFKAPVSTVNLATVKPPRSSEIMNHGGQGANERNQYERVLDQQIQELFKLTQKFKTSPNRGELWLRLAELYVEKAGLIDGRRQDEYDAKLRAFQAGKLKKRPVLNTAEAREYNKKAVQLYEWFQRDFPRDPKMSQALFFLGYNYFELGDVKRGAEYYDRLTRQYPNSPFVGEAHFALGEYQFENERWAQAYKEYSYIIKDKKHRLHTFSLYKGAWCLFRLGKVNQAMNYLEYIIKQGKAETGNDVAGAKRINRTRLEGEATRDIVLFYAEGGNPEKASSYFRSLVGGEISPYLEKLAYQYSDRGNKDASREVFKTLIAQNPRAPKSFEFQYQIVQNYYYAKNGARFKEELYNWVRNYGPSSDWYAANKGNQELIANSEKLRETTMRNYILQQHQTAQNSRAPYSQAQANEAYQVYLKEFPTAAPVADMHFYYGELLYDMGKYDEASMQYKWVVDNSPQNKFYGKAAQNLILAVERSIPSDKELQKRVGDSLEPMPLEPKVDRFVKAGAWYAEKFPTSEKTPEIKFRIGRLYYQSNQFDEASKYFRDIVKTHSKTKYAEYSANLLLDIYNLKKDYAGMEKVGTELLAVPTIASSKAGADIRGVLEKASFKKAQDLEVSKKYAESAQAFTEFIQQNPKSTLTTIATFNAAVNYERAGQNAQAMNSYQAVIASKDPAANDLKIKSRRLLAKLYQDSAQFEEAAKMYKLAAQDNPKDPLAPNLIYNAAVLYEALGKHSEAIRSYTEFTAVNKKRSENSEVNYSMAQIHRKAGQTGAAIAKYIEYVDNGGSDREKVVESAYWVSELYGKQRAVTKSQEWKQKTLAIQKRFAPNKKGVGATYAAKFKFEEAYATFKEMKAVKFPADPAKQKAAADKKINLMTRLTGELAEVIKYDSAEEIVQSLALLGEANEDMAQAMLTAPIPKGLNAEETKQYRAGIEGLAQPFTAKAREGFKSAVDRGLELEVYNDAFKTALTYMNKVDPQAYYMGDEVASDIRLVNWMGQ